MSGYDVQRSSNSLGRTWCGDMPNQEDVQCAGPGPVVRVHPKGLTEGDPEWWKKVSPDGGSRGPWRMPSIANPEVPRRSAPGSPLGRVSANRDATEKGDGLVGVVARVSGEGASPAAGPGEDIVTTAD